MDISAFEATKTKKAASRYTSMLNNIYVTSRVRMTYEDNQEVYTPGEWLNLLDPANKSIFGLTNFSYWPVEVIEENGIPTKAIFEADYYTIYNQNKESYIIQKMHDVVTVSYKNNKWQVTNVEMNVEEIPVDEQAFIDALIANSPETYTDNQAIDIITMDPPHFDQQISIPIDFLFPFPFPSPACHPLR